MRVLAFDAFVAEERFRELGVERADSSDAVYAEADFITLHLPKTPETENWLDAEAFAKMKDGVRILNVARGPLVVDADLKAALDSGKVAGRRSTCSARSPITDHPLFGYPGVVVTPHLGASTAEATDRAGYQAAEQVVAALTGGVVTSAVNVPAIASEDVEALGPVPWPRQASAGSPSRWPRGPRSTALEVEYLGKVAERDTRFLTVQVLKGALAGHTEEQVNDVNAPGLAEERGIAVPETRTPTRARLHRPRARDRGERGGAHPRRGHRARARHRPHLLEAWGSRFNVQLEDHLAVFRYRGPPRRDRPRRHGLRRAPAINIVSARRRPPSRGGRRGRDGGHRGLARAPGGGRRRRGRRRLRGRAHRQPVVRLNHRMPRQLDLRLLLILPSGS